MKEVRFHPRVPGEVRKIISYYEEIAPELAEDFWLELNEAIRSAQVNPERHHFDPSGRRRGNLKRFPYHFLFRVFSDHIRITIVRHDRRNPSLGNKRQ